MKNMKSKQGGFTLLELLVVVGIMAIIGGALISSVGGQETKAARGVATQAIAGIESAIRVHSVTENQLPNDLESLVCIPFLNKDDYASLTTLGGVLTGDTAAAALTAYKFGGESNIPSIGGGMGKKLADKFGLAQATSQDVDSLNGAGISTVRFGVAAACDNNTTSTETVSFYGSTAIAFGAGLLVEMDIPGQAFEEPRPDSVSGTITGWKNRGRGFSSTVGTGMPMMVWNAGTAGYNNLKLGAKADDRLIGLGVGASSDLVGKPKSAFAKAPFYGQVGKDKYAHYIALVNIGPEYVAAVAAVGGNAAVVGVNPYDVAFVQAVVDARGDFLDEEIAEFQGQKL